MYPYISIEGQLEKETAIQTTGTDTDTLVQCGCSDEEIMALLWLQQWYQMGGSDRFQIVRHLEFLKFLVQHGKLAV